MPNISVSLPSDLGDSLFPDSLFMEAQPHAGLCSVGIQRVVSHIPDGHWGWAGVGWVGNEPSSPGTHLLTGIVHTLAPDSAEVYTLMGPLDAPPKLLLCCLCHVLLPGLLHLPAEVGPAHPSLLSFILPLSAISLALQLQVKQRLSNQQSLVQPHTLAKIVYSSRSDSCSLISRKLKANTLNLN